MNAMSPNIVVAIFGVIFTGVVTLFGVVFTSQNRKIANIEKNMKDKDDKLVFRDTCHQAQDTVAAKVEGSEKAIKAEMEGIKTTLCAKIDGLAVLIQNGNKPKEK